MSEAEDELLDYRRNVVPTQEGQWTSASGGGSGGGNMSMHGESSPSCRFKSTGRQVRSDIYGTTGYPLHTESAIVITAS